MIKAALSIVEKAFRDKTDKAGKPYVNHLYRVRERVGKQEASTPELETVALLHDLLEDCPEWTADKLREHFPENIVGAVVCLTHRDNETYDDYLIRVLSNELATRVKRADLEDNMDVSRLNELTEKDFKRLQKYLAAYQRIGR